MTPKEKAKELINKYIEFTEDNYAERNADAKQSALICVDEILDPKAFLTAIPLQSVDYWQEVKTEIEKL